MIYSRFGTELTLVSKTESVKGWVSVQATAGDAKEIVEYNLSDLKADYGLTEINAAVAKLPMAAYVTKPPKPRKSPEKRVEDDRNPGSEKCNP